MPTRLDGKTAVVTGGTRRIGREIALALAREGADVAITYRTSQEDALRTAKEIEDTGRRALAAQCDVRSEASVQATVSSIDAAFGRLDILVNNAAIFASSPIDQISLVDWDAVFETNTRGPFLMARECLAQLRASHGRIVNIGSLGGVRAWASHAHYCASKAALHLLTQAMAKGFAPDVSVNCVAPGWIEQAGDAADTTMHFADKTPMRRNGAASDVAEAVVFFAAGPRFITGQILAVDGGLGLV